MVIFFLMFNSCEWRTEEQYVETAAGEHKEIELPGGSTVKLNAESELGWSPGKWAKSRHVTLKGEAFFTTAKGKKFTVRTKFGTVEVMGTIFNVYARKDLLEVQCLAGKVQVHNTKGKQKVLLKKGEEVAVEGGWMNKRQRLRFYPVWFKGESTFRDASLPRVFEEVERQYGVLVHTDSIENLLFSGKFGHKDLHAAMATICRTTKLHFNIQGDTVLVTR